MVPFTCGVLCGLGLWPVSRALVRWYWDRRLAEVPTADALRQLIEAAPKDAA